MKLFCLILVAGFVTAGLIIPNEQLALTGAILFLVVEVFDLISFYREAKIVRSDEEYKKGKTPIEKVTGWVRNIVVLGGLGLTVVGKVPGIIIWVGTLVGYVIAAQITQSVAKIPLRMTYGGYKVDRRRRK